jgi:hypothetical protein
LATLHTYQQVYNAFKSDNSHAAHSDSKMTFKSKIN